MMTQEAVIELVNIEKELKRLWDEEEGKNKTRACLFNLIIYTQKSDKNDQWKDRVHSIISSFPCRVIYIHIEEGKNEILKTSVTTQTVAKGIFCEIIEIDVSGSFMERVPYILLPLIVPDLPLYLLWSKDPSTDKIVLPALTPFAKRIIFDASATTDFQRFTKEVFTLINDFHSEVGDLNWSAIKGWRKMFATFFDTKEKIEALQESRTLKIVYHKSKSEVHPEIKAIYFQGWLAAIFKWKFVSISRDKNKIILTYQNKKPFVIELIAEENNSLKLPLGALLSVDIESNERKSHFSFERQDVACQVYIQFSDENSCALPSYSTLSAPFEGQEIVQELFYPHSGKHYKMMLETISQIPWNQK